ncbi:MAG: hypothetical protein Q9224_002358 [Gallowayella concinna]
MREDIDEPKFSVRCARSEDAGDGGHDGAEAEEDEENVDESAVIPPDDAEAAAQWGAGVDVALGKGGSDTA